MKRKENLRVTVEDIKPGFMFSIGSNSIRLVLKTDKEMGWYSYFECKTGQIMYGSYRVTLNLDFSDPCFYINRIFVRK